MGRVFLLCLVASCGRIGFDGTSGATIDAATTGDGAMTGDGANTDAPPDAAVTSTIALVGSPLQVTGTMGTSQSVMFQATNAGDALLFLVACDGSQIPSAVTVSVPGWTLTPLAPMTINTFGQVYAASYGAIAPDTQPATLTVSWTGSNCNRGKSFLADEFKGMDPTGGTTTFDATTAANGAGNCMTTVTSAHDGDAVWAACYAATQLTGPGAGYTKSAADTVGDFAEYKLTNDPSGTAETVVFNNPNSYVVVATTIKPQ